MHSNGTWTTGTTWGGGVTGAPSLQLNWYAYAHALLSSEYTPHVVSNGQVAVGYAGSLREQETDACVAVDQPSQRTLGVAAPQ